MKLVIDSINKNLIGPRLREARTKKGLTQKDLSEKLETHAIYIDRASISKIEKQKRIVTDLELVALSKILNVSVNWLLGITEN